MQVNNIHIQEFIDKFKRGTKKERICYILIAIIVYIAMVLAAAFVIGKLVDGWTNFGTTLSGTKENKSILELIYIGLSKGIIYSLLLGLIFTLFILYQMTKISFVNKPKYYDEDRKIYFMDNATMGGQRYLTYEEMKEEFRIDDINKEDMTMAIYGQLSDNGQQVLGYKKRTNGPSGSQNVMILAPMGTGKSFGPVRVNLLQAVRRGESFVVTDPKGELYSSIADYCKQQGMNVHVLNLAEPRYSEFWNVMEEVINPETERLDSSRLNDFASVYMQNSNSTTSPPNEYWYGCAINVIRSAVGLIAYNHEKEITDNYERLYQRIKGITGEDENTRLISHTMIGFPYCREIIRNAAIEKGYDINIVEEAIKKAETHYTTELNLTTVFDTLLDFGSEKIQKQLENINKTASWHPTATAYKMFKQNDNPEVIKSAMSNATLRFQIFADESLKNVLSHEGLHCADITAKHSAYFIILSDKTETTKPIASLFFNFLFKDVQDEFDKEQSIAMAEGRPNGRRQLTAMLDEFYSVGVIGGKPSAFGQVMSSSRSREIHIWIILQTISQLPALYGDEVANIIISGCSNILYLGGNDPETIEFIRSYVAGKATVLTESHTQTSGILSDTSKSNVSSTQRDFLTAAEAKEWHNKVLIAKQASYLVKAKPFPWIQHPCHDACRDISVYKEVPPIEMRMVDIRQKIADKANSDKAYIEYVNALNFNVRANLPPSFDIIYTEDLNTLFATNSNNNDINDNRNLEKASKQEQHYEQPTLFDNQENSEANTQRNKVKTKSKTSINTSNKRKSGRPKKNKDNINDKVSSLAE